MPLHLGFVGLRGLFATQHFLASPSQPRAHVQALCRNYARWLLHCFISVDPPWFDEFERIQNARPERFRK